MTKYVFIFVIAASLLGCAARVKVDNGYLVHEDLYRVPVLNDQSWVRFIPAPPYSDALYLRCPSEQRIGVFYTILCGKYDYAQMTPEDYPNRIYLNTYFSPWYNGLCPEPISRLTDTNFRNMTTAPLVNKEAKQFTIVYETTYRQHLCSSGTGTIPVKVMDVFIEEQKKHFRGGMHTRFVVFRYASPEDQFENGMNNFQEIVSKFQWLNGPDSGSFW